MVDLLGMFMLVSFVALAVFLFLFIMATIKKQPLKAYGLGIAISSTFLVIGFFAARFVL